MMLSINDGFERAHRELRERGMRPLFLGIKGSVVYDLPGAHKDLDVRGIYQAPTSQVLSLDKPRETIEILDGEFDFVGWEVEKFLRHLMSSNGNFIELLLTPLDKTVQYDDGIPLVLMAPKFLTRQLYAYYRGYAMSQFKRAQAQIRTGKGAIYTYREMYAGLWLLREGEIVFPWYELKGKIEDAGIYRSKLIDEFTMDREHVTSKQLERMEGEFADLNRLLDEAYEKSNLPDRYDGRDRLNTYLLRLRSRGWTA